MLLDKIEKILNQFFNNRHTTWHNDLFRIFTKMKVRPVAYILESQIFKNKHIDIWEPSVSRFLKQTKGNLFMDVGACYGSWSILLADNYKEIVAVEPEPSNMKAIVGNLAYSHIKNVSVVQAAVSDKNGMVGMKSFEHSDWFMFAPAGYTPDIYVPSLTLTKILGKRCADLVKVDVQGAEWQTLEGAVPVLNQIRSWLVEIHDLTRKCEAEQWFINHGYCFRWLDIDHIFALKKINLDNLSLTL
jgi:FkbM family methyltransferase